MANASNDSKEVWITGIGLLSCFGEGIETHFQACKQGKPGSVDTERFAPYPVHALSEPDWSQQISRRDMRQMEPWQQIGTYAAGLALEDAGAKDDEDLCGRMDMIVSAGGGERDIEVDSNVMAEARTSNNVEGLLAERLSNDLRPTLFLAQLSNLLAGNISIVHKVTGSSRTFMGEEGAGISAIETARARIASGQSDIVLVGGGYNGEREDMLLFFALGGYLREGLPAPIGTDSEGMVLGSIGAFLVLESADHARKRGAKPYAALDKVAALHGPRGANQASARMQEALNGLSVPSGTPVLSGATGAADITEEELNLFASHMPDSPLRTFTGLFGHGIETQFPLGVALAALALKKEAFFGPLSPGETDAGSEMTPQQILVSLAGHNRAEGLALLSKVAGA